MNCTGDTGGVLNDLIPNQEENLFKGYLPNVFGFKNICKEREDIIDIETEYVEINKNTAIPYKSISSISFSGIFIEIEKNSGGNTVLMLENEQQAEYYYRKIIERI